MSKKQTKGNVREQIQREMTERIVQAIKDGKPPWRKPWSCSPNAGFPRNIRSKKGYRGINVLLLECTNLEFGFSHRWWGTYKQWADLGCQVKKRPADLEHWGTRIVFWQFKEFEKEEDGEVVVKKVPFLRTYTVFNLEQVDDPDGKLAKYRIDEAKAQIKPEAIEDPIFEMAREVIAETKADITHGGDRAFYTPPTGGDWPKHTGGHKIKVPKPERFVSPQDYYYTVFHELGHWTEVQLDGRNDKYAYHELVAEMTSCFLAQACCIPQSDVMDNHERYLASWLSRMGDDPSFIFKASTAATKATDLILSFSGHAEQADEAEAEDEDDKPKRRSRSRKSRAA